MRVPLSWLREYVDVAIPVEELARRLTLAGLEVASIEYIGLPAGGMQGIGHDSHLAMPISTDHLVWDRQKIVVGHIVEVRPHPDADRLVLAMVESGIGQVETVVTGAPNLFPYSGQGLLTTPLVAAYAREGAELADPYSDQPGARMILKPRKLRGIENRSMVCSEKELGISGEHEGIMLLDTDAAPGTPLQDVLGDVILEIELTPNLARCHSIMGVAREVAALTGQRVRPPSLEVRAEGAPILGQAAIDIRDRTLNPRFMLALIRGVEIKPSPQWMQRRLRLAGMRPINNIVDITNYVMLETGQPLHAFDYDVLVQRAGGQAPTIITRTAEPGERLTTLDGVSRDLDAFTELVADTTGALSIAGVMGGVESEVYDASTYVLDAQGIEMAEGEALLHGKADPRPNSTTNVLLEAANWNFINIRQTLQAQRERGKEISSEAGTRFSRSVHPAQAQVGLLRAIEMMRQLAGGEIAEGVIDAYPLPAPVISVVLPLAEVERILGLALTQDEVARILESLEFGVERVGPDALGVTAPDHRMDIGFISDPKHQDIAELITQADLIEEIARIYGYDRIPNTLMDDALPAQRENAALVGEEQVRDLLVRAGLQEIVAYRLTSPEREALLTPPRAESSWPTVPYVTIANPISQDKTVLRHTLLTGLLSVMVSNMRWRDRQTLFEVGSVYLPREGHKLPDEPRHLAIAMTGPRSLPVWQASAAPQEWMDYFDLKGVVEALTGGLHLADVRFEESHHSTYFPGRAANLIVGGQAVGTLGEIHPLVREAFDLPEQPVMAAEIDLDALLLSVTSSHRVRAVSSYPAVYQDIAVVVDESVAAAEVQAAIEQAGGWLLRGVRLFDVYRGEQVGPGKKSLAYALTFQADDKTLRDSDADNVRNKIVKALKKQFSAELRVQA
jgi:phenylalanyl-tRNA synthetase beta chain